MAKLGPVSRIIQEDLPNKYRDLTSKLLYPINNFIETVTIALTNRLTFKENFAAQDFDLEVTAPVNSGSPMLFRSTLKTPCRGIWCVRVDDLTQVGAPPTAAPFITFENDVGQVRITNITGLVAGHRYRLRLICD